MVYGDKERILQILLNIISNSLKFTPNQGFVKVILSIIEEQVLEESQFEQTKDQMAIKRAFSAKNITKQDSNLIGSVVEQ